MIPFLLLGLFGVCITTELLLNLTPTTNNNNYNLTALKKGVCGALFVRAGVRWTKIQQSLSIQKYPVLAVVSVAAFTAILDYNSWVNRLSINELIGMLFSECVDENDLNGLCR